MQRYGSRQLHGNDGEAGGMMKRLLSDRYGNSAVELAIIMQVLVLLTCMAGDVAMAFKAKIGLQRAVEGTAQFAAAGGEPNAPPAHSKVPNNLAAAPHTPEKPTERKTW